MERARLYEKIGTHWVESIGIPGMPDCHFEIHHRENDGDHFIDQIYFVGPGGLSDVAKEIGVESPRILIDENEENSYKPAAGECYVQKIEIVSEVMIALHELGHQAQMQSRNRLSSSTPIPSSRESFLDLKRVLRWRNIRIKISEEALREIDSKLLALEYSCSDEETRILQKQIAQIGGGGLYEALKKIKNTILEQDATGRVFSALRKLENEHGVDFSKATPELPRGELFSEENLTFMPPWFKSNSITAILDIGLISHGADIPLFTICQRLFGNRCEIINPNPKETFDTELSPLIQLKLSM